MVLKIFDVLDQVQIDYWVDKHPNGHRCYRLMVFIANMLAMTPVRTRNHDQLIALSLKWLAEYLSLPGVTNSDFDIQSHLGNIEEAVFGLCASRDQLFLVRAEKGWKSYFRDAVLLQ